MSIINLKGKELHKFWVERSSRELPKSLSSLEQNSVLKAKTPLSSLERISLHVLTQPIVKRINMAVFEAGRNGVVADVLQVVVFILSYHCKHLSLLFFPHHKRWVGVLRPKVHNFISQNQSMSKFIFCETQVRVIKELPQGLMTGAEVTLHKRVRWSKSSNIVNYIVHYYGWRKTSRLREFRVESPFILEQWICSHFLCSESIVASYRKEESFFVVDQGEGTLWSWHPL